MSRQKSSPIFNLGASLLLSVAAGAGCSDEVPMQVPDMGNGDPSAPHTLIKFAPAVTRTSGLQPSAIVAADVNGDGGQELVVVNHGENSITVLLHNQDYQPIGSPYPTAVSPSGLAIADINLDGAKDLLVACSNGDSEDLDVLRGNGIGAFLPPIHIALGMTATGVVAHDFNGDGKLDVAVSVRSQSKVVKLINNSPGASVSFALPYETYKVGNLPIALVISDLNRDGRGDLVVTGDQDNQVGVLLGADPSTFETPLKVSWVGMGPVALATGELTGDQLPDIAAANFGSNTLSLLKGQGDGTFASVSTLPTGEKPTAVAVADLDQDGKQDLVVVNSGQDHISVLLGKGDGRFEAAQDFAVGQKPWAVAVADLDRDGLVDVATANLAGGDVTILYNRTSKR